MCILNVYQSRETRSILLSPTLKVSGAARVRKRSADVEFGLQRGVPLSQRQLAAHYTNALTFSDPREPSRRANQNIHSVRTVSESLPSSISHLIIRHYGDHQPRHTRWRPPVSTSESLYWFDNPRSLPVACKPTAPRVSRVLYCILPGYNGIVHTTCWVHPSSVGLRRLRLPSGTSTFPW